MTFKDETWEKREGTLGNIAEAAFESWAVANGWKIDRYGLNRPDCDMRRMVPFVRYTPDYLAQTPSGEHVHLIEVQGCGRDQTFKFKDDKVDTLLDWQYQIDVDQDVYVWLYDSHNGRQWLTDIRTLVLKLELFGVAGSFPEGKTYVSITTSQLDE